MDLSVSQSGRARALLRHLTAGIVMIVSLSFAGCNNGDDQTAGSGDTEHQADAPKSETPRKPIWEEWPQPKLAFMLTSEMHGYFEPCGCTSNQLGGMSRRADLLKKMTDAGWTVRGLDVGGLSRRTVRQSQIKFETTVAALQQLNYIGIGLGPEELRLDPDFIFSQHMPEGDSPLRFLSANVLFYDDPSLGTPLPSAIVQAGDLKVGVTSVLSKQLQAEVLPHPVVTWKEVKPALEQVMADFDSRNVDLRVLLSQGTTEESEALAKQFPGFDVVLTAEGVGDPDPAAPPKKFGKTLLIEAGRKGKYVGVLGVYPDDTETPYRYQLVSLERDDFDDTQSMIDLMQAYQTRLKDEQIVLEDGVSAPHPSTSTFVGADKCGECHTQALEKWQETAHAHALESLDPSNKRKGHERLNGVDRSFDPECLACHVTGWDPLEYIRYRSGFLNKEFAQTEEEKTLHSLLAGNQCENCHGPGSRHIELVEADELDEARKLVRITLEQSRKGHCERCHDLDNSPNFDFDRDWELIAHPGLD